MALNKSVLGHFVGGQTARGAACGCEGCGDSAKHRRYTVVSHFGLTSRRCRAGGEVGTIGDPGGRQDLTGIEPSSRNVVGWPQGAASAYTGGGFFYGPNGPIADPGFIPGLWPYSPTPHCAPLTQADEADCAAQAEGEKKIFLHHNPEVDPDCLVAQYITSQNDDCSMQCTTWMRNICTQTVVR